MKRIWVKVASAMACMALVVTNLSVASACWWLLHQPELPQSLREQ